MLQVREQRGVLSVAGAARVELDDDGSLDDARSRLRVAEQLRAAVISGGFLGRQCTISLPRSEVHVQSIRLPSMPMSELREAAAWEAANRLDVAREDLECDVLLTGLPLDRKDRQEVLVISAARSLLEARLDAVLDAGLRPIAVDTHFGGLARVLSRRQRRDSDTTVRAVLEVGDAGSTMLMLRGADVAFCKPLPIGGRHLDEHVAERLDQDVAAVRDLRLAMLDDAGLHVDDATAGAVYDAARSVIAELARDAMLCLRHFAVSARGARPEQLVLTGVHASEQGLAECLESTCRIPVRLDDESGATAALLKGLPGVLHSAAGPASGWTIAAGLSLRSLERPPQRRAA
jgi:Tfp pilus assembly PilM family ATPase